MSVKYSYDKANNVYYFRNSKSATSSAGLDFFINFLNYNLKDKKKNFTRYRL